MQFGILCVERHIGLYKKMEQKIGRLPKSKNYEALVSIVDFIKNDISSGDKGQIKAQQKKSDRICDYLDEELEDYAMLCLAVMIKNILTFYLKEDVEDIILCIENCLEIINQVKSEEYTNAINANADNEELSKYLDYYFEQELTWEYDTIEYLQRTINDESGPLSSKKAVKATKKKGPTTIKRLKAKEFMLQFNPKAHILKIGFGQYFYAENNQIKMSEEFTVVNLTEVKNLHINEDKKTAEFDSIFKKIAIHFIIKEVYKGTLDIMKFIRSYNETPFQIDTKYKDEISIAIDKDGYNISLGKPDNKKSVYLYNTKKGFYFQIYMPEPIRRFKMKSYKLTETNLSIEYDGLELNSNETVDNCEYNWILDIQPEMRKLINQFIEIAMNID